MSCTFWDECELHILGRHDAFALPNDCVASDHSLLALRPLLPAASLCVDSSGIAASGLYGGGVDVGTPGQISQGPCGAIMGQDVEFAQHGAFTLGVDLFRAQPNRR